MSNDANEEPYHSVWSEACATNYERLCSYACHLANDGDIGMEIAHNAITKILRLDPDYEKVGNQLNYLLRSVHNTWADWLNEKAKVRTVSIDDPDNTEVHILEAPTSDVNLNEEYDAYRLALRFELRRLNKRDKRLLILHLKKYKTEEIAARLHEDVRIIRHDLNVVKNRVHKRLLMGKAKAVGSSRR